MSSHIPILHLWFVTRRTTKLLLIFLLAVRPASSQTTTLVPGEHAPFIEGRNIDGRLVSFENYPKASGFIIVFIANTCPYSKAYEQRIIALHNKYAPSQYPVIAVNSNDPIISPGDGFKQMQQRAKSRRYPFPYLCDSTQIIADKYGAISTPQLFIVTKSDSNYTVRYAGAIDNDAQNKRPNKVNYAINAMEAVLKNGEPPIARTKAIGCSISRKKRQE